MTKDRLGPIGKRIRGAFAVAAVAALAAPHAGFSDAKAGAATSAAAFSAEILDLSPLPPAPGGGTYEYQLLPFHHKNFDSRGEFEAWMDDLGAEGWVSIAHFPTPTPGNHRRLFMRRVGGPMMTVDFDIEVYKLSVDDSVEKWVPEYDRLGGKGKYPIWFFDEDGKTYVVTEAYTLDGVPLTLGWGKALAGETAEVGPAEIKDAAKELAEDAYVPTTVGLSADLSDLYVVGFGETTPSRVNTVELKFANGKIGMKPKKWKRKVNKQAKKGFRLAMVDLSGASGTELVLVFARVKVNGEVTRRKCVVEPLDVTNLGRTTERLNSRGEDGFEAIIVTFVRSFITFQFVLCRDK